MHCECLYLTYQIIHHFAGYYGISERQCILKGCCYDKKDVRKLFEHITGLITGLAPPGMVESVHVCLLFYSSLAFMYIMLYKTGHLIFRMCLGVFKQWLKAAQ